MNILLLSVNSILLVGNYIIYRQNLKTRYRLKLMYDNRKVLEEFYSRGN